MVQLARDIPAGSTSNGVLNSNGVQTVGPASAPTTLGPILSLQDLFERLTPACQIKEKASQLLNPCLIAVFALTNLALYELDFALPYVSAAETGIRSVCSIAFALMTFLLPFLVMESTFTAALKDIKERSLSINVCQSLAVLVGLSYLFYAIASDPKQLLHHTVYNSLITVMAVIAITNYLEARLIESLREGLGFDINEKAPQAHILKVPSVVAVDEAAKEETDFPIKEQIPTSQVKIGDIIQLNVGEIVQCDGTVVHGTCQLIETRLSANGKMRYKQKADAVFSGSKITHGSIQYRVTALPEESFISSFSNILNERIYQDADSLLEQHNYKQLIVSLICIASAVAIGLFWAARAQSFTFVSTVTVSLLLIGLAAKYIQLNFFLKSLAETSAFYRGGLAPKKSLTDCLVGIKTLILDFSAQNSLGMEKMQSLDLIDKRVAESSLTSVLLSLAGRGESSQSLAVSNYVIEKFAGTTLVESSEFSEHPGRGLYGKVSGFDFTIGNEDFLLDRGVMVQTSEIGAAGADEYFWYVALQDEVIASIKFVRAFSVDIKHALTRLHAHGIRTLLCSMESGAQVDEIGKKIGLELADVYGGLNSDTYSRKVESLSPFALHCSLTTPKEVVSKAAVTLSKFDDLRWDTAQSDILLFSSDPALLADVFVVSSNLESIAKQNFIVTTVLTALLVLVSCFGLISPTVCILAVSAASIALLLNALRLPVSSQLSSS